MDFESVNTFYGDTVNLNKKKIIIVDPIWLGICTKLITCCILNYHKNNTNTLNSLRSIMILSRDHHTNYIRQQNSSTMTCWKFAKCTPSKHMTLNWFYDFCIINFGYNKYNSVPKNNLLIINYIIFLHVTQFSQQKWIIVQHLDTLIISGNGRKIKIKTFPCELSKNLR